MTAPPRPPTRVGDGAGRRGHARDPYEVEVDPAAGFDWAIRDTPARLLTAAGYPDHADRLARLARLARLGPVRTGMLTRPALLRPYATVLRDAITTVKAGFVSGCYRPVEFCYRTWVREHMHQLRGLVPGTRTPHWARLLVFHVDLTVCTQNGGQRTSTLLTAYEAAHHALLRLDPRPRVYQLCVDPDCVHPECAAGQLRDDTITRETNTGRILSRSSTRHAPDDDPTPRWAGPICVGMTEGMN